MNELSASKALCSHLEALGYPRDSLIFELSASKQEQIDAIIRMNGRTEIAVAITHSIESLKGSKSFTRYDPHIRNLQYSATKIGARFYVATDGNEFLWFHTDAAGRPSRLDSPIRASDIKLTPTTANDTQRHRDEASSIFRKIFELSKQQNWPNRTIPLLLAAHIKSEDGEEALKSHILDNSNNVLPTPSGIEYVEAEREKIDKQLLERVFASVKISGLTKLSPKVALAILDENCIHPEIPGGPLFLPRWLSDLLAELLKVEPGNITLEMNSGAGNITAALGMSIPRIGGSHTIVARDELDAAWTLAQQLLVRLEVNALRIGDFQNAETNIAPGALFDRIILTPPFGLKANPSNTSRNGSAAITSEESYIQKMFQLLESNGRAVALLPTIYLSTDNKAKFREELIHHQYLSAVIDLGAPIPSSKAPVSALIFDRSIQRRSEIYFALIGNIDSTKYSTHKDVPGAEKFIELLNERGTPSESSVSSGVFSITYSAPTGNLLTAGHYISLESRNDSLLPSFEYLPLSAIAEISRGGKIKKHSAGSVPFIGPGSIRQMDIALNPSDIADADSLSKGQPVYAGESDIVINGITTYRGSAGIIETGRLPINSHVFRIRVKNKNRILPKYLAIAINSKYVRDALREKSSGGVIPELTVSMLKEILIPIPSLAVQQTIVDNITLASTKREAAQNAFQAAEARFSSLVETLGQESHK